MAVQYFVEDAGNVNSLFSVSYMKKGFFFRTQDVVYKKKKSPDVLSRILLINFINLLLVFLDFFFVMWTHGRICSFLNAIAFRHFWIFNTFVLMF